MNLYALRKTNAEQRLAEIDPEWRERFVGDWQRAGEHYGLFRFSEAPGSNESAPERIMGRYDDPDDCDCEDPFCEDNEHEC